MTLKQNTKLSRKRIIYSFITAAALLLIFVIMINYIYQDAEKDGFDTLRLQATQLRDDITLQMISDQENLLTLARMASNHHEDGSGFQRMIDSFESIGLIDNIAFLTPDNTLLTRSGLLNAEGSLSFEDEVRKGTYISGRVRSLINPGSEVVRSAVPVLSDGNTVAMLYGTIRVDALEEHYIKRVQARDAHLYLVERSSGNFIIDTYHDTLGNLNTLDGRISKKGHSYDKMREDVKNGGTGYTAFTAEPEEETLYLYYMPMDIANWEILVSQPESVVFERANATGSLLAATFLLVVLVMMLYIAVITMSERRQSDMIGTASRIRKLLIEINQHHDSIVTALESITLFAKARSAFFVDNEGEDYNHALPAYRNNLLIGKDRQYFIETLESMANKRRKDRSVTMTLVRLDTNAKLRTENPDFYEFLKKHSIRCVCFAAIITKDEHASILGVINPGRNDQIRALLSEIAVCFAMAIYNKGYLSKTEATANTDSLTGLSNRLAYKRAIAAFDTKMSDQFSCIYVDVNELHIINNQFGHAAGDEMLLYVASTLQQVFPTSHIYRMGGDEFLVFSEGLPREEVVACVERVKARVEAMDYHVSIGMDFRSKNIDTEAVVKEAEKRMYEAKAEYYQQKERRRELAEDDGMIPTGRNYVGMYCVSFKNDTAYSILESSYFKKFSDYKDSYTKAMLDYIHEAVKPEYHRGLLNALKFEVLKSQMQEGRTPTMAYSKANGERIVLTIYPLPGQNDINETIWLFEREGDSREE